jgi:hypothetical protein
MEWKAMHPLPEQKPSALMRFLRRTGLARRPRQHGLYLRMVHTPGLRAARSAGAAGSCAKPGLTARHGVFIWQTGFLRAAFPCAGSLTATKRSLAKCVSLSLQ